MADTPPPVTHDKPAPGGQTDHTKSQSTSLGDFVLRGVGLGPVLDSLKGK